MQEIIDRMQEIGFSQNEAKVYLALTLKNPMSGYEVAKNADITRTMVYDILKRLVQKEAVVEIEADPKLYAPVPYKDLFQRYRQEYMERITLLEDAMDRIETDSRTDNCLVKMLDHEEMIKEVGKLIKSAKYEIYLSIWEQEARMFADDLKQAFDRGVKIISFSYCKLPYDFGIIYEYGISQDILKDIWKRRRIIVVVDRERILIGEGNEKIEEISVITSNTMIVELAIDQMLLDIIQLCMFRKHNVIPEKIESKEQYIKSLSNFHKNLGIELSKVPRRVDED